VKGTGREGEDGEGVRADIEINCEDWIIKIIGLMVFLGMRSYSWTQSLPTWCKWRCQPHHYSWLRPLSVMEGKRSDGWLLAAPSQMAAGTALRLADNQRTSKLSRLALGPIAFQSQEAKGTEARKEASV